METVLKAIGDWLKSLLTAGIMSNLSGLFDAVNEQVGDIAQQVGTRPSAFEPRVFAMIESLSRNVVLPIAGIILTFIACYELIEMITQHNNMAQFVPALIMRWVFKTAISVWFISNTFDIVMAVFDLTQKVVADSSGIIAGNTRVNDIGLSMLEASLMQMEVGPLFGLFLQSFFIGITMRILSIIIFVIVYGRMIEIYCMVSLAPIPMATWGNHEQSHMGQNYLKCLFALGFQGFLILICVAIYAVLIQSIAISGDAINSIWSIVGYTVLLCFSLFKTSSVTKSVLGAHSGGAFLAAYISVPRDLTKVKSKIAFNLTKRQLICFGSAALIGVPLFFLLRESGGNTAATLGMMAVMLPAFFLGMYEKNGQPMEKLLSHYLQARFLRPKIRPYKTNNYYAILMRGGAAHDSVLEKE